ncbi:MAG: GNAT family N-acetyltransferase [Bacteroidetes bacterium]|nr:GNAT family N-acetyltransferase [Bacteroidota bacterium]
MQITEVKTDKDVKAFHKVPEIVYKNDSNWVCQLESEIEKIFSPEMNVFFKNGEATRWILKNDNGELIGRVAAFINKNKAYNYTQPTGGMGFFECINDEKAAIKLFNQSESWLTERGMQAMDGPINFGENDNYWGLLVEGFTHPGIGMQYNPPYYQKFFEDYGFKFYFEQVTNHLDLTVPFPERFWKIADWIRQKPIYSFEHINFKEADRFINDFKIVYDTAWQFHENFTPINKEMLKRTLLNAKDIIDEEFIWFAYQDEKPIAFLIMFPDVNQILKHLNGKLHLWNKLKFLYLKQKKTMTRARITIMGVVPHAQKSGIESGIFWHLNEVMKRKPWYTELELSWVGDFNPKMRALHEAVGAKFAKKHITYRKIFNDENKIQRSTIIPVDTKEKFVKENK